jgi:hypothetical protein
VKLSQQEDIVQTNHYITTITFPCHVYDVHGDYIGNLIFGYPGHGETLDGSQTAVFPGKKYVKEYTENFRNHALANGTLRVSHEILGNKAYITLLDIGYVDRRGNIHLNIGLYELAA